MSEFKNMKIRITSPEHYHQVLDYLASLGYNWGSTREDMIPDFHINGVRFLYTYEEDNVINYGTLIETFQSEVSHQEVTLDPAFLKPVPGYHLEVVCQELFINDVKVDKKYIDQLISNVNG